MFIPLCPSISPYSMCAKSGIISRQRSDGIRHFDVHVPQLSDILALSLCGSLPTTNQSDGLISSPPMMTTYTRGCGPLVGPLSCSLIYSKPTCVLLSLYKTCLACTFMVPPSCYVRLQYYFFAATSTLLTSSHRSKQPVSQSPVL